MPRGIDTSTNSRAALACLAASGCAFVFRYYCASASPKRLTRIEAEDISAHGMRVGAVWESGSPTGAAYFGKAKGEADGRAAYRYAADTIGQPAGSSIYFAVDYDASQTDRDGVITAYFEGIRNGFHAEALPGEPAYSVGVYGSGATCSTLLSAALADKAWLAQSSGWDGYDDFVDWHVKQHAETVQCGLDVDPDEVSAARPDFGGFVMGQVARRSKARVRAKATTRVAVADKEKPKNAKRPANENMATPKKRTAKKKSPDQPKSGAGSVRQVAAQKSMPRRVRKIARTK